ncbi:hypothetical protein COU54_00180 [Candidatus Pacearchaeota archaeon CG10_big_fil_rev_8_21_14_0_10_31_24]|nr:MAG: hypothetical protein COU54_00180 [Candidatus Pacearchaeota archaeon CG10_big_fil_rev_8_21_14_0_10_31_24]
MGVRLDNLSRDDADLIIDAERFVNTRDIDNISYKLTYNAEIITLYRLRQRVGSTLAVLKRDGSISDVQIARLKFNLKIYRDLAGK